MEQRYLFGTIVLVVIIAFIFSSAARKAIRSFFYFIGLLSLLLVGIRVYALVVGRHESHNSAGYLLFVIGAVFFSVTTYWAFKYASGLKAFEESYFEVHDHSFVPIPVPGLIKDFSYILAAIQTYLLFFASQEFYRQNLITKRDVLAIPVIALIYIGLTRFARLGRPLENTSRAKEGLFFVLAVFMALTFFVTTGAKVLRSQISFMDHGMKIMEYTKNGNYTKGTALDKDLKKAILAGDVDLVKKYIDEGASLVTSPKSFEMSPLMLALSKHQSRVAEILIRHGAPVGEAELKYAIVNVDAAAIRMALSKNQVIPKVCKGCFQAAAKLGDSELTAYLLMQLAKNDERGSEIYQRALAVLLTLPHWDESKKTEYGKTYDFLISKGAKPEALIDGYLPLLSFASQTHLYADRFLFLKAKGVNLNAQDKDGNTYLHFAADDGRGSYEKLLEMGLDPTIKNNSGQAPSDLKAKKALVN